MTWTENEIQALKAQEAKDLAVELLHKLESRDRAPVTAGQVQLKELQYGLKIKEAEAEDNRQREAHQQRIKELELQIEQEKRKQSEAVQHADRAREEHAKLVEQVQAADESMSIQLERASREHQVKMETLEAEYAERNKELEEARARLEGEKAALLETIQDLTELSEIAADVSQLREEIASRKATQQRELERLDEQFEVAEYERNKKINHIRRDQELALAELETEHKKRVMQLDAEAATKILSAIGKVAVLKTDWDRLHQQLRDQHEQDEAALTEIRSSAEEDLKRAYNITTTEVFDVTKLFYSQQSLTQEAATMRERIGKLEAEITRMRQHVEREPERLASALEAAKVRIENTIEQAGKR